MAMTSRSADLTSGPMLQKIVLFSVPLAASSILQLLFNAADVVVVGRFAGSTALAAVGSNGALINLLVNLFVGLSLGANVVAARCCLDQLGRPASKAAAALPCAGTGGDDAGRLQLLQASLVCRRGVVPRGRVDLLAYGSDPLQGFLAGGRWCAERAGYGGARHALARCRAARRRVRHARFSPYRLHKQLFLHDQVFPTFLHRYEVQYMKAS